MIYVFFTSHLLWTCWPLGVADNRFAKVKVEMDSKTAQKTWELSNSVESVNSIDDIYRYDKRQQQDILTAKPWEKE